MYTANQILKKDGLSLEILYKLSYQSKLGKNLKKNISNLESESSNLQNRLEELKNTKIQ